MSKPHVAMFIPTLDKIGGAERQLLLLSKELVLRGWQVTVVSLSGSGAAAQPELESSGVASLSLGMRKAWIDPRGWRRYLAWAATTKPEILHAHLPHAVWFARCIRLLAPVRVLVDTLHTTNSGTAFNHLIYRLTRQLTNRTTCVSAAVAEVSVSTGISLRQNLTILPNGVEIPPERATHRAQNSNTPSRPFRWLAIGRLDPVKDYPTLIRAFAMLSAAPMLTIAGAGPEEQRLKQLALDLNILHRIHFAGFQNSIHALHTEADAFVLSSLWEGLPMSILEASAASLPVVSTAGPGSGETLQPGLTGIFVPVGDAAALSRAMAEVMAMTQAQRQAMGLAGRCFVCERFSLAVVAGQWERLYTQLLDDHPHPSRHG
jgi:glycosyltransferase involved in cell wall biosynthesis